jgi:hypothetical protein
VALKWEAIFYLFPVNPSTLAKYQEAFQPSKAKDDPTDAEIAVDMPLRHPEHLKPQSAEMRTLGTMVEQRRPPGERTNPDHQSRRSAFFSSSERVSASGVLRKYRTSSRITWTR